MFSGKKILLGVTGSIAAYKSILLVRLLIKEGAEVKVIMTPSAKDFVTPLSLSTLSKNEVLSDLFNENSWANHVILGRWADVFIICPLSCNTLSKMANGTCDNLLMAVYLSSTCPVIVAPAMDEDMWHHPSTLENLKKIKSYDNQIIPVETGELASGLMGEGRMSEPENIMEYLRDFFLVSEELRGELVLITAGPTRELIDPVRYISNHSSGKMGVAVAEEFFKRGAIVTLILGPSNVLVNEKIRIIRINSAAELEVTSVEEFKKASIIVMSAAVADYSPQSVSTEKIKKKEEVLQLTLEKNTDILKKLGDIKTGSQVLVGFALETTNEKENALLKLKEKKADLIVLNSLREEGAGFGTDTNKITIFDKRGNEFQFDKKSKKDVARDIVNTIIQYKNA